MRPIFKTITYSPSHMLTAGLLGLSFVASGVAHATDATATVLTAEPTQATSPQWVGTRNKRPTPVALQIIQHLAKAEEDGLQAKKYSTALLQQVAQSSGKENLSDEQAAQFNTDIQQAASRYLRDLHTGRIDPKSIREYYKPDDSAELDIDALLAQTAAKGNWQAAVRAATPKAPMYAALRKELNRYLSLRGHEAWAEPLPNPPKGKAITRSQNWQGLDMLARRLVLLGDLNPESAAAPVAFGAELQSGLQSFQKRHGLPVTGRIDRATIQQLNTPLDDRAQQIARTMERLRWTPMQYANERLIVVNVPEYRLRAYTLDGTGKVLDMLPIDVIVGDAKNNQTVLFNEHMKWIEFGPFWNVPASITRKEMLPKLRNDPTYIQRNNYEIVGAGGTTTQVTPEVLASLASGRARIRQRPGKGNALGGVKFMLPNRYNIYLHDTPSKQLFQRTNRALSHGCIRVADPAALAHYVLRDEEKWPMQRIHDTIAKRTSRTVQLEETIPVVMAYFTAFVNEEGKLNFVPDVYGHDRLLKQALEKQTSRRAGN